MKKLKVKKLDPNAILPTRSHPYDAGLDLYALEDIVIPVGSTTKIKTGIAIAVDKEYYAQINDRSGCALKGLRVGAGVVDFGYSGECCVILHNLNNRTHGNVGYLVNKGDRIAQIVIHKIELPEVEEVLEFESSTRGTNGFNSTGR